ncbi:MAG: penicillin-binding transpeptidase domain-containing protein [Acidobacteria bacterium]|jgi:cell division protein FtsI/penicillin-binding protein 2|nr:penicillin-binding transpeptidase domain-containing protein [Acidobacteriota bacterium]
MKGQTVSLTPGMFFDVLDGPNANIKENLRFLSFTIDRDIQDKIHSIFKNNKYHGSFLLINLNDGSIAAAYSNSSEAKGNAAFSEYYEPGSIIKLITLFAYLQSNSQDVFPLQCTGLLNFSDKIFYDWIKHNIIKDYEKALVVSCNICFAKMGIRVGAPKLTSILNAFYFNIENGGCLKDRYFDFKTGTFNSTVTGDSYLADLSVGLNEIAVTTFHSALIPAIIAQNGTIYAPHLIKNEKNLLNLAFYNHLGELLKVANDAAVFLKIKDAMIQVVEDENGTGRRSKIDSVHVALKTGTAGKRERGLDAVMSGFFPAEKPQYAFGFRLESVGKAEYKGALFLKDFLVSFYGEK